MGVNKNVVINRTLTASIIDKNDRFERDGKYDAESLAATTNNTAKKYLDELYGKIKCLMDLFYKLNKKTTVST
jgi:hypothetical protein